MKNNIKELLIVIIIYISLLYYLKIDSFNILGFFILIILHKYIKKYRGFIDKKNKLIAFILSVFYSVGFICYNNLYTQVNIFKIIFSIKNFFLWIGLYLFILFIISYILKAMENARLNSTDNFKSNRNLFIVSTIVILLLNTIYFLSCYPGLIAPDSIYQIKQFKHIIALTDHHPVLHTLFIKVGYKIGSFFTSNENIKAACSTIIQMIIMSSIYSYFIVFLNNHKINKKIIIGLIIIFGLLPVYAFYSISMWKDVLFGGFFLLFIISLYKIIENQEKIKFNNYLFLSVSMLLSLLFRNNALYMFIIFIPIYLFYFRKKVLYHLITCIITLSIFFVIKYPIYNHYQVERSKSWEYLGMPIQQVGRMAFKNVKFTKKEQKQIEKFITIENLKKDYNPVLSDGIKFSLNLNQQYFDTHNKEFLMLWKTLVYKHFDIAVESYFMSTIGYWYPNLINNAVELGVVSNDIGLYNKPLLPKNISKYIKDLYRFDTPILSLQWNIGLVIWLLFLLGIICIKNNKKYFLCYIPILGMWATLMVASPVYGMLRYVFWAYTTFPFYILMNSFVNFEERNKGE